MRKFIAVGFIFYLLSLLVTSTAQVAVYPSRSSVSQAYQTIQDEGSAQTQRTILNFTGAGVSCTDDSGNVRTNCSIPGGSSGPFRTIITDDTSTRSTTSASNDTLNISAGLCWGLTKSAATARITAGNGTGSYVVYCAPSGAYVILYSTGAGLTVTCSGVTCTDTPTPAIPEGYYPLASGTISTGASISQWSSPTDLRDFTTRFAFLNGSGMAATVSGSVVTLAVDTALVQMKSDNYTPTAALDASGATTTKPMKTASSDPGTCAVGEFVFRTDTGATKACTALNTWTSIGGSASPTITTDVYWPFGYPGQSVSTLNPGANKQRVYLFTPLANYSFSKIRYITSGNTGYVAFAIVTSNGNTIVSNSAARCNNASISAGTAQSCSLAGTVSLTAGTQYYFVFTADASNGITVSNDTAGLLGYANGTGFGTYVGEATNNSSGSGITLAVAVPLGTVNAITGSIAGVSPPAIVFVP